jgi:hypothetical protein
MMSRSATHVIAGIVVLGIVVPISFWAFDRSSPVVIEEAYIASPQPLIPGEPFTIGYRVVREKLCPFTAEPLMFDGGRLRHRWVEEHFASGGALGRDDYLIERVMPLGAKDGVGTYFAVLSYECNPVQKFWPLQIQTPAVTFVIGKAEQ